MNDCLLITAMTTEDRELIQRIEGEPAAAPRKTARTVPARLCAELMRRGKMLTMHIWQEYLELVEHLRKTERGKQIYAMRKETIERVFADAKEKHAMRWLGGGYLVFV
jgi:hypothetical protein